MGTFQNYLKRTQGHFSHFKIDVSMSQIMSPYFFKYFEAMLERHKIPASYFSLAMPKGFATLPAEMVQPISEKNGYVGCKSVDS